MPTFPTRRAADQRGSRHGPLRPRCSPHGARCIRGLRSRDWFLRLVVVAVDALDLVGIDLGVRAAQVGADHVRIPLDLVRSEEHTSELQSLMRTTTAVFCLKKKTR